MLNETAVNEVKRFSAPKKGRSAEVLLVLGEKADTTQTVPIVPTSLEYWICTTFPRERRLRQPFLAARPERPMLDVYRELAADCRGRRATELPSAGPNFCCPYAELTG
jgi:hypothetical protein